MKKVWQSEISCLELSINKISRGLVWREIKHHSPSRYSSRTYKCIYCFDGSMFLNSQVVQIYKWTFHFSIPTRTKQLFVPRTVRTLAGHPGRAIEAEHILPMTPRERVYSKLRQTTHILQANEKTNNSPLTVRATETTIWSSENWWRKKNKKKKNMRYQLSNERLRSAWSSQ